MKPRASTVHTGKKPGQVGAKHASVDALTPNEAQVVLRALLAARRDLGSQAERIAEKLFATVTFAGVADTLSAAIEQLDMDDTDAGRHAWGYVEPSEAAWELVGKTVEPYLADLKRRVKLRREDEALEVCKGIVLGLYRAEQSGGELLEYAVDCPSELAGNAVEMWQGRRRGRRFPPDFVEKFTPNWPWLLR